VTLVGSKVVQHSRHFRQTRRLALVRHCQYHRPKKIRVKSNSPQLITSFAPQPTTHPALTAILINPNLFLKVKSFVPGCAAKLSAAPPTTIVIALPGPCLRMFIHDRFETEPIPRIRIRSRYRGILKLDSRVRRWGLIPGKRVEKSVPVVGGSGR
jgi:hypothetical protein